MIYIFGVLIVESSQKTKAHKYFISPENDEIVFYSVTDLLYLYHDNAAKKKIEKESKTSSCYFDILWVN